MIKPHVLVRIVFPSCYGPRPLIPAPFLVGAPIPDAVWELCRMMHQILPTTEWRLMAMQSKAKIIPSRAKTLRCTMGKSAFIE